MATETMKAATRDGVTLRYLDAGSGDPSIVFVHGWCCDSSYWREQLLHFAAKHRVVAVDLRGHGSSDKPDQDYSVGGFVEDLAWLIGELGLDRPVVVGHSMGGTIAHNLVHRRPGLARGVVLVDAPLVPFPEERRPQTEAIIAALATPSYLTVAETFLRTPPFFFNAATPPELVEKVVSGMMTAPQRVMHSAIASTLQEASMPAGEVPVPALFIRAVDAYFTGEAVCERYPGIEVVTVQAAHFLQMERPEETNALIERFVGGLD